MKYDVLEKDQADAIRQLKEEIEDTFNSVQVHRTRTEMEVSVLNDLHYPTPASKYWQAVREQNVMVQGITTLSFDYRKACVNVKIMARKIDNEEDDLEKELLEIEQERLLYQIKEMKRAAKHKAREVLEWSDIKDRESHQMSEAELGNVDNHQLISYTKRWINQSLLMTEHTGQAEKQNLMGQVKSGIKQCNKRGVLDDVISSYNKSVQNEIKGLSWAGQ